ncbi:actin regulatory protein [Moniliophthora roreri MCA 2997]|uniref:Actin regulatory protein n=2 Tax=Moniliophthora roreri TaxID=221103 RepID=V2YU49_MONRO|nr:actin regulatory protein [Moniliophthora roreri MCA 2997]KAI3616151.1 actin regulatory protein [Moniliophthora roreri]
MAHLTKPNRYDIKDSNIALLGSDLEKRVREHAGDTETAWEDAGKEPGLQIWRIEEFHVVPWPKERKGSFYDGDSYIVLHTYRKTPESEALAYDLHFWLGEDTTQDEAGTAAYKTVELDDHLHGKPIQYREVQGSESSRFLSYFPKFQSLRGGVASGFHHVTDPPPLELFRLYRISSPKTGSTVIREVAAEASSLVKGDVYVLDKGSKVLQLNTKDSVGKEKFKAAEFVQSLVEARQGQCDVTVYDEGPGAGVFLAEFGSESEMPSLQPTEDEGNETVLIRLSDASGQVTFEREALPHELSSADAYILDNSPTAIYVWLGNGSSLIERRLAPQYAQKYLYETKEGRNVKVPIVRLHEGDEDEEFLNLLK